MSMIKKLSCHTTAGRIARGDLDDRVGVEGVLEDGRDPREHLQRFIAEIGCSARELRTDLTEIGGAPA